MLARSPNRRRAVKYLAASGATPISVVDRDGVCSIVTGKITGTVATRWWIATQDAVRVASAARRLVGAGADAAEVMAAVQRSAGLLKATLTPDEIAIRRAADAMVRLDVLINKMKHDGTLREFNSTYKAKRAAAKAEARGYMSYGNAIARLKLALIPGLQSGKPVCGLFEKVFRST
jgi:hypothetical protein